MINPPVKEQTLTSHLTFVSFITFRRKKLLSMYFEIVCLAKKVLVNAFPCCSVCPNIFSRRMYSCLFLSCQGRRAKLFVVNMMQYQPAFKSSCGWHREVLNTEKNYSKKLFVQYPTIKFWYLFSNASHGVSYFQFFLTIDLSWNAVSFFSISAP